MNKAIIFTAGLVGGVASTLFVLSRLSDNIGLRIDRHDRKFNIEDDWDDICNECQIDDFNPEDCLGCEGPVWEDGIPKCGNYEDAPICNNPKYNMR